MIWNQSGFKVEDGYITLSHYYNEGKKNFVPLKFKIPYSLMNSANIDLSVLYGFEKIKQITLFRDEKRRDKKGQFYLSVTYDYPNFPQRDNGLYQAIDLGVGKTVCAVNMEAKFFEIKNPRQDLYWNPIIDEIQARRDHCKKTTEKFKEIIEYVDKGKKKEKEIERKITDVSNKWIEMNDIKKKCHNKCSNQIKDGQHKWSDKMVKNTRANTVIVGELSVKEMAQSIVKIEVNKQNKETKEITKEIIKVKSKKLNRSTQNQGYISRFVRFLTYKHKQQLKLREDR